MLGPASLSAVRPKPSQSIVSDPNADLRQLMAMLGFDASEDGLQSLLALLGSMRSASQAKKASAQPQGQQQGGGMGLPGIQQASLGGQPSGGDAQGRNLQESRNRDSYARTARPAERAPREDEAAPEGTVKAKNLSESGREPERDPAVAGSPVPAAAGLESWRGAPVNRDMVDRVRNPAIRGEIERAAQAKGIDPDVAKAIVGIESSGNPNARTGSYKGLFQLSDSEFRKYGRGGNIYNPKANIEAGLNSLKDKAATFEKKNGRPPTPTELYLAHQQGEGGLAAHLRNPEGSAVRNMASTGEGRQKGIGWARKAVWGNVPTDMRRLFPRGVDSMTSREFAAVWASKLQGIPYSQAVRSRGAFGAFGPGVDMDRG